MSIEWREPEVVQAIDRPAHAGPPSRVRDVLPQPRVQGRRERVEGGQGHGRMMVPPYQNAKYNSPPGPGPLGAQWSKSAALRRSSCLLALREGAGKGPKIRLPKITS